MVSTLRNRLNIEYTVIPYEGSIKVYITGKDYHVMMSTEDLERWKVNDRPIQDALPGLTNDEREFLITGLTPQEWEDKFGGLDD